MKRELFQVVEAARGLKIRVINPGRGEVVSDLKEPEFRAALIALAEALEILDQSGALRLQTSQERAMRRALELSLKFVKDQGLAPSEVMKVLNENLSEEETKALTEALSERPLVEFRHDPNDNEALPTPAEQANLASIPPDLASSIKAVEMVSETIQRDVSVLWDRLRNDKELPPEARLAAQQQLARITATRGRRPAFAPSSGPANASGGLPPLPREVRDEFYGDALDTLRTRLTHLIAGNQNDKTTRDTASHLLRLLTITMAARAEEFRDKSQEELRMIVLNMAEGLISNLSTYSLVPAANEEDLTPELQSGR